MNGLERSGELEDLRQRNKRVYLRSNKTISKTLGSISPTSALRHPCGPDFN